MTQRPSDLAETEADLLARFLGVTTPVEISYLDLDDDGVPDAVLTRTVVGYDTTGDGHADLVETLTRLDSQIDVTGHPSATEVSDAIELDVDQERTTQLPLSAIVDLAPGMRTVRRGGSRVT